MPDDKFESIHHHFDRGRTRDEDHSIQRQLAVKFANRSSAAKAATRLSGPADTEPSAPSLTAARGLRLGLSLTQILGSAGAAVTAAFLGSRLGVAGTLIGAALASVISVVGGAIYTSSIKATKLRVARTIVAARAPDGDEGMRARAAQGTQVPPPLPKPATPRSPDRVVMPPARPGRPALRGALVASLACSVVFAGALVVVTGYESVTGTALSGGQAGGLTILGGQADVQGATGGAVTDKGYTETSRAGNQMPVTSTSAETPGPRTTRATTTSSSATTGGGPTHGAGSTSNSSTSSTTPSPPPTRNPGPTPSPTPTGRKSDPAGTAPAPVIPSAPATGMTPSLPVDLGSTVDGTTISPTGSAVGPTSAGPSTDASPSQPSGRNGSH